MRVLVTGATGLIGAAVLARLSRDGHELIATARATDEPQRRVPWARWIAADFVRLRRAEDWLPLLSGIDAVVNCVGVLQSDPRGGIRDVQVTGTVALFEACEHAGVRRVIHVSAIGAAPDGPTEFSRTKAEAERELSRRNLDWVILRPGLVLGPGAFGGTALLRSLAALPGVTPLVHPEARMQVIGTADLADAVARALAPDAPVRVTWDVAHPEPHRLADIVLALRRWLGLPPATAIRVSAGAAGVVSTVADGLGWLGWRNPFRSTAIAQLAAGVVGDPAPWLAATKAQPMSLAEILAQMPPSVQERWFARLYLLKPVCIATLSLFWIATGVIALGPGRVAAMSQLAATDFPLAMVGPTVFWGAWFDIAIGTLLLWRRFTRAVLLVMLAATPLYLLAGTVLAPGLWLDPLGPLLKILPLLLATAFTLAILDER